ncbi:hypothetical protein [Acinetobacter pittii]|uniref:hypothetical protein n=1 Tax=Acinetobacter pittii TaxID=48296 RepID=UPI001023E7B6|nr:hypothetical protein [Acinetobacter pittii]MDQ8856911.1 hypothetical protein [Acinetobacter pittii]MDQ8871680.1 hypothetical protein [Acinetobacter pittii]RZH05250.1 hypothetical protein EXE00_15245 [Acinetobacter pittii]
MIYIKRDPSLIPPKLLEVAKRAKDKLETLPAEERKDFIKKKSHIWRSFSKYLAIMSHGKCWYSEVRDAGANFDVDHFRPKAEAKRSEDLIDEEGYSWLAFDWENFRLSAQNCNRLNKDEESNMTNGKGSWFPLLDENIRANWIDRCIHLEKPLLIDPINKEDLSFIDFDDTGRFVPNHVCIGQKAKRIKISAEIYGLNREQMREIRFLSMKDVKERFETIMESALDLSEQIGDDASMKTIERQIRALQEKTRADSVFSQAVRRQLQKLGADEVFIDRSLDAS